jgi:hypothetical protein
MELGQWIIRANTLEKTMKPITVKSPNIPIQLCLTPKLSEWETKPDAASSGLDKVAKTTIWLVDASNFDCLNKLYAEYFPTNPPSRSTPTIALPKKEFQLSIEAIATVDSD